MAFLPVRPSLRRVDFCFVPDPNILRTVDTYDRMAIPANLDLSREELVKSIIGTIGSMDAYMLPDAKGTRPWFATWWARPRRPASSAATRSWPFGERSAGFADVLDAVRDAGRVVVLGAPEAIQAANAERQPNLQVTRVM
jgi:hypothetical protein